MPTPYSGNQSPPTEFDLDDFEGKGNAWGGAGSPFIPSQPTTFNPYQTGFLPTGSFSSGPAGFDPMRRRKLLDFGAMAERGRQFNATPGGGGFDRGGAGMGVEGGWPTPQLPSRTAPRPMAAPGAAAGAGDMPPSNPLDHGPVLGNDPTADWGGSGPRLLQNIIGLLGRSGGLDPRGSQFLLKALEGKLDQDWRSRMAGAVEHAGAYSPDDPYLSNYARMQAYEGGLNEKGRALNDLRGGLSQQAMGLLQDLLRSYMSQDVLQKDPDKPGMDLGGMLGGLGGLIGGIGAFGGGDEEAA
jgi:hypothetical protein